MVDRVVKDSATPAVFLCGSEPCAAEEVTSWGRLFVRQMTRTLVFGAAVAAATLVPVGVAGAIQTPITGQPGTTQGFNCGTPSAPVEPGNAANAPGSAFNETLPGRAGTVYAGNGPGSTQHAGSTAAVSQYDAACRQLSSH
jgi:hypothetical protein